MTEDPTHFILDARTTRLLRSAGANAATNGPAEPPGAQAEPVVDVTTAPTSPVVGQEMPAPESFAGPPMARAGAMPPEPAPLPPGWDTIATPVKPLPVIVQPIRGGLGLGTRLAISASLLFSLLALAISGAMLAAAWMARNAAVAGLDNAIAQVDGLCGPNAAPIVFPFSQTIHFKGNVALPDKMVIPFKGNIPINTIVRINIPGLVGSPTIEVPINTTVPIDTQVPVPGGITIPIDTSIPVNQQIPIDLCAQGGPARNILEQAAGQLKALRKTLSFPSKEVSP